MPTKSHFLMFIRCLILNFLSSACDGDQSKKSKADPDVYFIKGNPEELLRDTQRDVRSFIERQQIEQFKDFGLREFFIIKSKIRQKSRNKIANQSELERKNSTSSPTASVSGVDSYEFEEVTDRFVYRTKTPGFEEYPRLEFSTQGDQLQLTAINGLPVTPIHYSYSSDKRSISFLASADDGDMGVQLISVVLSRNSPSMLSSLRVRGKPFEYFLGTGWQAVWTKPLTFSICGSIAENDLKTIRAAIDAWSEKTQSPRGKIGSLSYQIEEVQIAKPFTDLNQNCINLIENYRLEDQEKFVNTGVAHVLVDPDTLEILDAQIFIFKDALKKATHGSLLTTATHEIGHTLGLGHEFRRNPIDGKILYPSIMGYDGIRNITQWDVDAILNLYPSQTSTAEAFTLRP